MAEVLSELVRYLKHVIEVVRLDELDFVHLGKVMFIDMDYKNISNPFFGLFLIVTFSPILYLYLLLTAKLLPICKT